VRVVDGVQPGGRDDELRDIGGGVHVVSLVV
jgi:hypothetical protein